MATEDADVDSDAEVLGHERLARAIRLQNNLTLKENTLRSARVDLLGLSDHDRLVFQVVEDSDLLDPEILEARLDDALLEVAVESQDL